MHRRYIGGQFRQRRSHGNQDAPHEQSPPAGERGQSVAVDRQPRAKEYDGRGAGKENKDGNREAGDFCHRRLNHGAGH